MNGVSPGIRKRGKRAQVHPGAGQQNAPGTGGDQTARCEEILIGAILEENAVCPGNAFFAGATIGLTYGKTLAESCEIGTRLAASTICTSGNVCPRFLPEEFGLDVAVTD